MDGTGRVNPPTTNDGLPILKKAEPSPSVTEDGLPILKKKELTSADFTHGYKPSPDDIKQKQALQTVQNNAEHPKQSLDDIFNKNAKIKQQGTVGLTREQLKAQADDPSSQLYKDRVKQNAETNKDNGGSWKNIGTVSAGNLFGGLEKDIGSAVNTIGDYLPGLAGIGAKAVAKSALKQGAKDQQAAQANPLPNTPGGRLATQGTGFLPDAVELAATPELDVAKLGKLGDVITKYGGKYGTKAVELAGGKFPLQQSAKSLVNAYSDAREAGKTQGEATEDAAKASLKGYGEGVLFEGAGDIAGNVSNKTLKYLTDANIVSDGKLAQGGAKRLLNASAQATAFSTIPVIENAIQGKSTSMDEIKNNALFGFVMGGLMPHAEKTDEPSTADKASATILQRKPIIDLGHFMDADISDIKDIHQSPETAEELSAKAVNHAQQGFTENDPEEKQKQAIQAGTTERAAAIKSITNAIVKDKNGVIEGIQDLPVSDEQKQAMVDKVNAVHKEIDPIEQQKSVLSQKIEQNNATLEQLNKPVDGETPGEKIERETKAEGVENENEQLTNEYKSLIKQSDNEKEKTNGGEQVAEQPGDSSSGGVQSDQNEKVDAERNRETGGDGRQGKEEKEDVTGAGSEVKAEPAIPEKEVSEPESKNEKPDGAIEDTQKKEPLGISKERTKKQREERGLEDIPESEHKSLKDMFSEGKQAIESGDVKPREVAAEVSENKRNLSSKEVNAMLVDRRSLHDESESLRDRLSGIDPDKDPLTYETVSNRLKHVENELDKNEQALRGGARENSLALNSMRSMINHDYSHTSQAARMRAKAGGELTEAMKAELDRYDKELKQAKKELEEHKAAEAERIAKEATDTEVKKSQRAARKAGTLAEIKEAKKQNVDKFLSALKDIRKSGTLSSDIPYRRELAAAVPFMKTHLTLLVKEGITEFKDIIDNIHDEFVKHIPGLTKKDVVDALAGTYDKHKETKNELLEQKNAIIRLSRLTKKLDDLKSGVESEKSERKLVSKRKDIADLEAEIRSIQKQHAIENLETRTQEALQRRLDRINQRIKDNDYQPPVSKPKVTSPSAKTIRLQAAVRRAENNFDAMADRLDSHSKTKLTKALDRVRKIRLAIILSGTKVMGKLLGFGEAKKVTNQLDEMMNHLNSKTPLLKNIINRSPRYAGGYDPKAEVKAMVARYNLATVKDVWDAAKTGQNDLDRIYGKAGVDRDFENQHSILNLFQNLHKALKTPTQRSEFFRSMEHRLNFYAQQGEDIHDPDVQFKAGFEAFADSKRAILMNDNLLTDKFYKTGLRNLEHSKDPAAQGLGAFIRNTFPITKVPTNFALNVYDRITGAVPGLSRATPKFWKAIAHGAESLSNEEADSVSRIFAKGQVGLGLMALAYFSPNIIQLGGYNSGKRKEGDLKEGDVIVDGVSIPHNLAHNDVIEAMQFAATIRRAQDYADEKMQSGGTLTGIAQGAKGIASQIPFVDSRYIDDLSSSSKATSTAGTFLKNQIEPRLMQEFAEYGDKDTDKKFLQHPVDYLMSETKKRDPQTILENLKTGIPGWRETVPEKQTPLGKKLSKMTDIKGNDIILNQAQIKQRKAFMDDGVKQFGEDWRKAYNASYINDKTEKDKRTTEVKYWRLIGRSENWIQGKLDEQYQKGLNKFIEENAVDYSEGFMREKLAEPKKEKNKFSIKKQ